MELVNVSGGRINHTLRNIQITIQSSDHPYGLFSFKQSAVQVDENAGTVNLTIERLTKY